MTNATDNRTTEKELITIALKLVRFHYEKDDAGFDESCIELEKWFYDRDEIDLAEFAMACRCPACAFVPMEVGSGVNPDGLPVGLTISEDGSLLNWRGENYVRQSALGGGECEWTLKEKWTNRTGDDHVYGYETGCGARHTWWPDSLPNFCPTCGARAKVVKHG